MDGRRSMEVGRWRSVDGDRWMEVGGSRSVDRDLGMVVDGWRSVDRSKRRWMMIALDPGSAAPTLAPRRGSAPVPPPQTAGGRDGARVPSGRSRGESGPRGRRWGISRDREDPRPAITCHAAASACSADRWACETNPSPQSVLGGGTGAQRQGGGPTGPAEATSDLSTEPSTARPPAIPLPALPPTPDTAPAPPGGPREPTPPRSPRGRPPTSGASR